MVVKVKGEFVWHAHEDTDDLFLVLKGELVIELPEEEVRLGPIRSPTQLAKSMAADPAGSPVFRVLQIASQR